jgi:cobalt-precorrin 5A hydrolase/precorrin-3B C17-methyltransferase
MGPGSLEQITPAAKTAINKADAIIGYSLYLDLIKPYNVLVKLLKLYLLLKREKERKEL